MSNGSVVCLCCAGTDISYMVYIDAVNAKKYASSAQSM